MKLLSLLALLTVLNASGQNKKGFVFIGPAALQYAKGGNPAFGGSAGFGVYAKSLSLGIALDAYHVKNAGVFVPFYADIKIHFSNKNTSPFITLQPGYLLRNNSTGFGNTTIAERGGPYLAGGFGVISFINKVGFMFQAKAAMLTFSEHTLVNGVSKASATSRPGYIGLMIGVVF